MTAGNENAPETDPVDSAVLSFTRAASAISSSHRDLQQKIETLDLELARSNEQLQKSLAETQRLKTYLNHILNCMSNCLLAVDSLGRVTVFNRAAEQLTGYKATEVCGRPYLEIFSKRTTDLFTPVHTLESGEPVTEGEKEIGTKNGDQKLVKFSTSLLTDAYDNTLGAIEVFSDLSDIRALEDRLNRIKILAALADMAAVVAHEIRNPLNGIGGYATLLTDDLEKNDPKREMAEQIIQGARRLDELVENLLLLVRPGEPSFETAKLGPFIRKFLAAWGRGGDIRQRGIMLKKVLPAEPVQVEIDRVLMERALSNILDNAVQAMPQGGKLEVVIKVSEAEVNRRRRHAQITISDTGVGMSKATVERLFTPFFTTRERGIGLGLAVARNLIRFQRGEVSVSSLENQGTTVTISLPIVGEHDT